MAFIRIEIEFGTYDSFPHVANIWRIRVGFGNEMKNVSQL